MLIQEIYRLKHYVMQGFTLQVFANAKSYGLKEKMDPALLGKHLRSQTLAAPNAYTKKTDPGWMDYPLLILNIVDVAIHNVHFILNL